MLEISNEEDFEAIERWGNHAGNNALRFEDIPKIEALDPCPMEYLVEPLIVGRSITTLTGEAGCGKSTLALFLASLAAERCRVLYLDRENPLHVVQERFKRLAIHEGNNLRYVGGWSEVPLPSSEFVKGVVFDSKPSPLIVIDSLAAFFDGKENDADDMRAFFQELRKLTFLGASIVVLHHTGKGDASQLYRGSSDFKASADLCFHLSNKSRDGRLHTIDVTCFKNRLGEVRNFAYEFDGQKFSLGSRGLIPAREVLVGIVRENPGITQSPLETAANKKGIPRREVRTILGGLLEEGMIRLTEGRRNSKQYTVVDR